MARKSQYEYRKWVIAMAIHEIARYKGRPPALREVSERTSIPLSTIHSYLDQLQDDGIAEWQGGAHRTLRLTDSAEQEVQRRIAATVEAPF